MPRGASTCTSSPPPLSPTFAEAQPATKLPVPRRAAASSTNLINYIVSSLPTAGQRKARNGARSDGQTQRVDANVEGRACGEAGIGRLEGVDGIDFAGVHRTDVHAVQRGALVDDLLERRLVVLVDQVLLDHARVQRTEQLLGRGRGEQLDADRLAHRGANRDVLADREDAIFVIGGDLDLFEADLADRAHREAI